MQTRERAHCACSVFPFIKKSFTALTLKHVLSGWFMALNQGRFTWRHDSILQCLVKDVKNFLNRVKARTSLNCDYRNTYIKFVVVRQPKRGNSSYRSGLLFTKNDMALSYDSIYNPLMLPPLIM